MSRLLRYICDEIWTLNNFWTKGCSIDGFNNKRGNEELFEVMGYPDTDHNHPGTIIFNTFRKYQ